MMTNLSLTPSGHATAHGPWSHLGFGNGSSDAAPRGYAGQRHRSPGALAAAIALNAGAFALIIALPATQYLKNKSDDLRVHWVKIDKEPPPNPTEPVKHVKQNATQKTIETPEEQVTAVDSTIKLTDDTNGFTRGEQEETVETGTVERVLPPPHVPIFRSASRDPRYEGVFHPPYPPALVREGLEGSVTVRVTIDETGRVIACELVKATDPAFFRETKEQALKRWRFRPATSDGVAVQSQQTLTVNFQLEG